MTLPTSRAPLRALFTLAALSLLLIVSACTRTQPVLSIEEAPVRIAEGRIVGQLDQPLVQQRGFAGDVVDDRQDRIFPAPVCRVLLSPEALQLACSEEAGAPTLPLGSTKFSKGLAGNG